MDVDLADQDGAETPTTRDRARRPDSRLAAAVIGMALFDLRNPDEPQRQRDAADFFRSKWLDFWCDRLDVDAGLVRDRVLARSGGGVSELGAFDG